MIPVYGTEIGLDAVAIGWLLSTFSICTFAVRVFMPILSQLFKEWSIIIFVMISAGLTYIVFPFTTSLTLLFLLCWVARCFSRGLLSRTSFAAASDNA